MTSLLFPMGPKPTPSLNGPWEYWRPPDSSIIELGMVCGVDVALPVHFHDEDQLTFVLAGRRRFVIGDDVFDVAPGQGMQHSCGNAPPLAVRAVGGCLHQYVHANRSVRGTRLDLQPVPALAEDGADRLA